MANENLQRQLEQRVAEMASAMALVGIVNDTKGLEERLVDLPEPASWDVLTGLAKVSYGLGQVREALAMVQAAIDRERGGNG